MATMTKDDLMGKIGSDLGTSDWIDVTQEMINQFADVTYDHQFIHVDEEKAKMTPFGGTVAHGFLTLSLLSKMGESVMPAMEGVKMGVNYGSDKMRFLQPVPSGKRVRGHFKLLSVDEKKPGQFLLKTEASVEIEGIETPALIAEWLTMQFVG
jgi:acyl dehydratase